MDNDSSLEGKQGVRALNGRDNPAVPSGRFLA